MIRKALFKILLASAPALFVLGIYFVTDPFKVLYHYDNFEADRDVYVILNKDYTTTEMFLNNEKKYNYDSYIFGSSKSRTYLISEWQKHVQWNAFFHFDAYFESLIGIKYKVDFLHKHQAKIKNALFVLDAGMLGMLTNDKSHLYRKHPALSGESQLNFQLTVFKDFLDVGFLTAYIKYLATKKVDRNKVDKAYFSSEHPSYDKANNEEINVEFEEMVARNKDSFYSQSKNIFYERSATEKTSPVAIGSEQLKVLREIKKVMEEDGTNYKIVISPSYDQEKLNPTDLATLQSIFGTQHVHDFSGINAITNDVHNYYDATHYRVNVSTQILNTVYK